MRDILPLVLGAALAGGVAWYALGRWAQAAPSVEGVLSGVIKVQSVTRR